MSASILYYELFYFVFKEESPAVDVSSSAGAESGTQPSQSTTATSAKRVKMSLGSLLQTSVTSTSPSKSPDQAIIEAEFNSYILMPKLHSEEDPLVWWRIHKVNFPRLSKLAQKYLCVPATSTPSERLVSTSGNVVTCQRTCLKPSRVDMLVFLSKNL